MTTRWLLFLVLGMLITLVGAAAVPETSNSRGDKHPVHSEMQQGGSVERHARVGWLGLAFGVLQVLFYLTAISLGFARGAPRLPALLVVGLVYGGLFVAMVLADRFYSAAEQTPLWFSFPPATALMLYGVWAAPALLMAVYVWQFDHWILREADITAFRQTLKTLKGNDDSSK